ncbi:lipase family protein [Nocardia niigatensis]
MKSTNVVAAVGSLVATAALQFGVGAGVSHADAFYRPDSADVLAAAQPGDVLDTRTLTYHMLGVPLPVTAIQIRYRSTDAMGRPAANVTTVLEPSGPHRAGQAIAYQSYYDSLNPEDSPSRSIQGDVTLGGLPYASENDAIAPLLALGFPVIIADTEGQRADFAAGPEYAYNTLNSIRAAAHVDGTGVDNSTRIAMMGYSGGAIATDWAAALAPTYAPEINDRIVGATEGGVLVDPAHNLGYVGGSLGWSGVAALAVTGVARSFDIDFDQYLNAYGRGVVARMQTASIMNVLFQYPGLNWAQLVKPEYADPNSVAPYVDAVQKVNLGNAPTPTVPMQISQGAGGFLEGTAPGGPGTGPGDGVMVTDDVRQLARQYCDTGNESVQYHQYDLLSHAMTEPVWVATGIDWILHRFAGDPAPSDCGSIASGNPLD